MSIGNLQKEKDEGATGNGKDDQGKEAWGPTMKKAEVKLHVNPLPEEPPGDSPATEPWEDTGLSKVSRLPLFCVLLHCSCLVPNNIT